MSSMYSFSKYLNVFSYRTNMRLPAACSKVFSQVDFISAPAIFLMKVHAEFFYNFFEKNNTKMQQIVTVRTP